MSLSPDLTAAVAPSSQPSAVTAVPAAPSKQALAHFQARLSFETDCADVEEALRSGARDFVVMEVRGPNCFAAGHVPGAINLPYRDMTEERMAQFPEGITFVVYCAGPHCNAANKAALRLAQLGLPVKEMIGGLTGWVEEGFKLETS
ncbi:rhodanese-like domain-containing protein [Rhodovibrionaceae bacterium A322]